MMVKRWEEKGLDVKKIKIKESRMGDLRQQMQNFAFSLLLARAEQT
jgi:ATP-dependent RNA helicase DDX10/DBP4